MDIKQIAKIIAENNGTLYLVGGAVRDKILNREIHDEDYVVVGIESKKFIELFPNAHIRGKAFEVFDIDGKEFALARKESKIGVKHTDFKIETNSKITIEEDLARRDLTINAIAQNVLTDEIIDPFNGIEDIKNKLIRKTTKHFREDPLRVYRTARFASELNFEVTEDTIIEMKSIGSELKELSQERVFNEFRKALLSDKPSIFLEVLRKAEVLQEHFIEVYNLIGVLQPEIYHPEGDAYNHTIRVLDITAVLTKNYNDSRKEEIRFAALVHDFGKALTKKEEYPHHYGHEENGIIPIMDISKRLKVPNRYIKCGKTSSLEHMKGGIFDKMKTATKVDFIERIDKSMLGLDGLQIIVNADRLSSKMDLKLNDENELYKAIKGLDNKEFVTIGRKCLEEVTGKIVMEKYNLEEGIKLKNKLHEERVKWMKDIDTILFNDIIINGNKKEI